MDDAFYCTTLVEDLLDGLPTDSTALFEQYEPNNVNEAREVADFACENLYALPG